MAAVAKATLGLTQPAQIDHTKVPNSSSFNSYLFYFIFFVLYCILKYMLFVCVSNSELYIIIVILANEDVIKEGKSVCW